MNATVEPKRGGSFTEYTISGPLQAVFKAIETIFSEYDPRGYATKVRSITMEMNGSFTAEVWRANSCD